MGNMDGFSKSSPSPWGQEICHHPKFPVSYTHLVIFQQIATNSADQVQAVGFTRTGKDPVSYTHLDVYKRQALIRAF